MREPIRLRRPGWSDHRGGVSRAEEAALEAVRDANLRAGAQWRLGDRLIGGMQSGAWNMESTDGSPTVVKPALTKDWTQQIVRAERAVAVARAADYPTPAWLATGITASGLGYQIQEFVPGGARRVIGVLEARQLIGVLELQAGVDPDPGRCWSDLLEDDLGTGLADLRAGATGAGPAAQELACACDRLLNASGPVRFPRADLVHGDFRPGNILFDGGVVSGVIDIEAFGSGTRVFDYATLLDHPEISDEALVLLVEAAVDVAGPTVLRLCFARVALDLARFIRRAAVPNTQEQRGDRIRALADRVVAVDRLTRS